MQGFVVALICLEMLLDWNIAQIETWKRVRKRKHDYTGGGWWGNAKGKE